MYERPDNSTTNLLGAIFGIIFAYLFVESVCLLFKAVRFTARWLIGKIRIVLKRA